MVLGWRKRAGSHYWRWMQLLKRNLVGDSLLFSSLKNQWESSTIPFERSSLPMPAWEYIFLLLFFLYFTFFEKSNICVILMPSLFGRLFLVRLQKLWPVNRIWSYLINPFWAMVIIITSRGKNIFYCIWDGKITYICSSLLFWKIRIPLWTKKKKENNLNQHYAKQHHLRQLPVFKPYNLAMLSDLMPIWLPNQALNSYCSLSIIKNKWSTLHPNQS